MKHVTIVGSRSRMYADVVNLVLKQACDAVSCPKGAVAAVIFVDDRKMRQLNRKYREKDKTANVLAFPANHESIKALKHKSIDLGDIFICLAEAKREAKKYGWTVRYSVARLALHGFLHLLGYDHVKEKEARKMEGIERRVLGRV